MATVSITITGKQSSRVTVKYSPGECQNKEGYVGKASMTTKWGKADWEQIAADERAPFYVSATLGVNVDELRSGIQAMQEQTKTHGPAVYRAHCGKELLDRREGPKRKTIPELTLGWIGAPLAAEEDRKVDRPVPEPCLTCRKLKAKVLEFMTRDANGELTGQTFHQTFHVCRTFSLVPGAVPPPETEHGKGEQNG